MAIPDAAWRLRKAKNLVKLLALAPAHGIHRDRLIDLLWPESDAREAANSFRQTVHVARAALAPRFLVLANDVLHLSPAGPLWIDIEEFESTLAQARAARDPDGYRAALDLYAGELLPEDRLEDWAIQRREELRSVYVSVLSDLATICETRGEVPEAIARLDAAVVADPTNEEAHIALMRLHALSGRRSRALHQYEQLQAALRRELDVEPDEATRALRQDILEGRLPGQRTVAVAWPRRHNIPAALTSFVGRERELAETRRTLAEARLVTLTGPGGCGKTRLALEVAGGCVDAYAGGVWLVELDALSDAALLPHAIAASLGPRGSPDPKDAEELAARIGENEILLVLDGCEQLGPATARLVDVLLRTAPRLRILATSRTALALAGEAIRPVPPLAVPREDDTPDELGKSESVRLFVDRARFANPAFALGARTAATVAQICRRLDGLPLALELAAAHVRMLTVEQIVTRLDNRFDLLTTGSRAVPERHQTLRAVVDWSYERLSDAERSLYERLSVFAGGWTLEAAEAVCGDVGAGGVGLMVLLARLVDQSLVTVETAGDDVRYRMLDTIREYARGRLVDSPHANATAYRHADHFRGMAETAAPELLGPREADTLDRLEREVDNLRAALDWSLRAGAQDVGLRLGGALGQYWYARGLLSEGRRWLTPILASAPAPSIPRVRALVAAALLAREQADLPTARALLEEAVTLSAALGEHAARADALGDLGVVCRLLGDLDAARATLEESLRLQRELGNEGGVATALRALGLLACFIEEYARAESFCAESLEIERRLGNEQDLANAVNSLGVVAHLQGRLEAARSLFEEAVDLSRAVRNKPELVWSLSNLGLIRAQAGELDGARTVLREGLAVAQELEDRAWIAGIIFYTAALAIASNEVVRGYRLAAAASHFRDSLGMPLTLRERLIQGSLLTARARLGDDAEPSRRDGLALSAEAALAEAALILRARPS